MAAHNGISLKKLRAHRSNYVFTSNLNIAEMRQKRNLVEFLLNAEKSFEISTVRWNMLANVAIVLRGRNFSNCDPGNKPFIQGRDLRVAKIQIEKLARKGISAVDPRLPRTRFGDILLQKLGDSPAAYLVSEAEAGIPISETVFLIRMKALDHRYCQFLTEFLNSEPGRQHVTGTIRAAVVKTQSLQHLNKLTIPRLSEEGIEVLLDACAREGAAKEILAKATASKQSLFGRVCASASENNSNL